MTNPSSLTLREPLDVDDAREAARLLARQRRAAEDWHRELTEQAAEAEAEYRRALAGEFAKVEGGTAAEREAKARAGVADRSYQRDLKAGMVKVAVERLRGLEGERAMLRALTEWSMRMRLDERGQLDADRLRTAA